MRPLTYENEQELAFLTSVYARRGALENTSFGILEPDGKTHLVRAARSPSRVFRDASKMAAEMDKITAKFTGKEAVAAKDLGLPVMESVKFALNTAACDTRLIAIIHTTETQSLNALETKLAPIAWGKDVVGHFLYATTANAKDLDPIKQAGGKQGLFLIKPGTFGLSGELIAHIAGDASSDEIREAMIAAHAANKGYSKDSRQHIGAAEKASAKWQSATSLNEGSAARRAGSSSRRRGQGRGQRGRRGGSQRRGSSNRRGPGVEVKKSGEGKGDEKTKKVEANKIIKKSPTSVSH